MAEKDDGASTLRKVGYRLIPFLMICYLFSFIDRVNLGFAALQIDRDIHLGPAIIGFGGGLFFLGYFLFEVPSNLAMNRFGARRWLARIMISWGLVSAATAFIVGPWSFYANRLLLGAAEAGFFPGVLLYLTWWFPAAWRGRVVSMFYVAVPLSSFVGSPVSAAILQIDGWLGLHGWQWLFLIEGTPSILLGLATYFLLPDRPKDARWLSQNEREWLESTIASEQRQAKPVASQRTWRIMLHPQVLLLALIYAGSSAASNGLSLWQPQILKSFGLTTMQTGLINSVPFFFASIAMLYWGRRSDQVKERVWSTALPLGLSAVALGSCLFVTTLAPTVVLLSFTLIGTYAFKAPFWALSTEMMGPAAAPAGLAQINAIGNLAGFLGSSLIGLILQASGSYTLALLPLIVLEAIGCIVLVSILRARSTRAAVAVG
ncbi:MFS transporter [Methylobacterium pseudosasicola]|uniref:Sugar phosphate permease n=1 Tax=Methylobacterium pseudosasicola TaxID=582667 RepID=A0A1I4PRD4_9HYPH|nr:MFS transporter [Methylobacterium pseudosasicola]SFM30402.1 Sugar phosphate permease [Methylobacterium pseudosasicola]